METNTPSQRYNRSEETVRMYFGEVDLIDNDEVRAETIDALRRVPHYFFSTSASKSNYHHPHCRLDSGLAIHTKMVATVYNRVIASPVEAGVLSEYEADLGLAACLLHDTFKEGLPEDRDGPTTAEDDHDLIAAEWVRTETDLDEQVSSLISTHMGAWYDGPTPNSFLQWTVHFCDMVASTDSITPHIHDPPTQLRKATDDHEDDLRTTTHN